MLNIMKRKFCCSRLSKITPLLSIICFGLLAACAYQSPESIDSAADDFKMSIAYYNDEGDSLGHMVQGQQVLLMFPTVKGQIFGVPKRPVMAEMTVSDNQVFEVKLPAVTELDPQTLVKAALTDGLSVVPEETSFLRAATMAFDQQTRKPFGAGSLIDEASGDNLMLMYFDQPCRISGSVVSGDVRYEHDIDIPVAGWHWIAGTQPSQKISRLRALQTIPASVVFAITVTGMRTI